MKFPPGSTVFRVISNGRNCLVEIIFRLPTSSLRFPLFRMTKWKMFVSPQTAGAEYDTLQRAPRFSSARTDSRTLTQAPFSPAPAFHARANTSSAFKVETGTRSRISMAEAASAAGNCVAFDSTTRQSAASGLITSKGSGQGCIRHIACSGAAAVFRKVR